jgi:hypothetical protein
MNKIIKKVTIEVKIISTVNVKTDLNDDELKEFIEKNACPAEVLNWIYDGYNAEDDLCKFCETSSITVLNENYH